MKVISGNTAYVKALNTERLREALKQVPSASKLTLARATGLSTATCGNILTDLLQTGEVLELPAAESSGGRPARMFAYNAQHTMLVLLHLAKEARVRTLRYDVVNAAGEVQEHHSEIFPQITIGILCNTLEKLMHRYPAVKGAAISYPGVVQQGVIDDSGDLEELFGCNLKTLLEQKFPIRVTLENDMNLAALGYHRRSGCDNLVYLAFFNDILPGCGTIANGQLIRGQNGFAGEVTFLPPLLKPELQLEKLRTNAGRVALVSRAILSACALLNPAQVVLCGAMFRDEALQQVLRESCSGVIRQKYLPELVFRANWTDDVRDGLLESGLLSLCCPVQLIRRSE